MIRKGFWSCAVEGFKIKKIKIKSIVKYLDYMDYASMMALKDSSPSPSEWVIRNKLMLGLGAVTLVWCICIMPLSITMLNPGQ